ncbi:hypothetical protein MSPP1_000627 [Malassezia sp. CBS 17886]|nr:hypothetical protein MSPP1_000627 [Malassezia sp. CBS 17886]
MDTSVKSHQLRPYHKERDDLAFIAATPMYANAGAGAGASGNADGASPFAVHTGPTNRYLRADTDAALDMSSERMTPGAYVQSLVVGGILQYASTCLANPFEIGKILLQVQWTPRESVWMRMTAPRVAERTHSAPATVMSELDEDPWGDAADDARNDEWADDDEADEDEPDRYFRELGEPPAERAKEGAVRDVDAHGYVVPASQHDDDARPEYMMPVVVRGGVWEMMKAVVRGPEGWLGLWKGTLTTFLLDLSTSTLQPIVSGIMSVLAPWAMTAMPIAFSPYPVTTLSLLLTSHLITGVAVSPLDLVRTRLVVQSTSPKHRRYGGPLDALRKLTREGGGLRALYLTPNLLVPTLLDYTFRPLMALGAPLLIENVLHLDPSSVPISYAVAELVLSTLSLIVTLPIETVRRRLQLQYNAPLRAATQTGRPAVLRGSTASCGLWTCVQVRPVPYTGAAEAMYRIITEETCSLPPRRHRRASQPEAEASEYQTLASSSSNLLGGIRCLYRGFGMGFSANLLVFMLTLLTGEREGSSAGWAEM